VRRFLLVGVEYVPRGEERFVGDTTPVELGEERLEPLGMLLEHGNPLH
jgi:hypothetical protein